LREFVLSDSGAMGTQRAAQIGAVLAASGLAGALTTAPQMAAGQHPLAVE
jgi:hypothetical protein